MEKPISDLGRILMEDYRLTTAEILYRFPDHPLLLQTFIWQNLDLTPEFPVLKKFLDFWEREIEGKVHSVSITSCEQVHPSRWRHINGVMTLH